MVGRIETYLHSDKTTPNKGGSLIKLCCTTDFGAKTDEFIAFAKKVAQLAYAAGEESYDGVIAAYPEIEAERAALSQVLRETVTIKDIRILSL